MKLLSDFIKELQALKEKHGDLPVVVDFSDYRPTVNDELEIGFSPKGAIDNGSEVDCIVIV